MIKKANTRLFTKPTNLDQLKELWKGTTQQLRRRISVITVDDLLQSDTHPDNALAELEQKMGKSAHSFQHILANSL